MREIFWFLVNLAVSDWVPLSILAIISFINQTLYYTYFWQLKEYRLDRMRDFVRTKSGREKIFTFTLKVRIVCLVVYILTMFFPSRGAQSIFVVYFMSLGLVVIDLLGMFKRIFLRKLYRPEATIKALLIVALTILVPIGIPLLMHYMFYLRMPAELAGESGFKMMMSFAIPYSALYASGLATFFNAGVVLAFYPITLISKNIVLAKARKKMAQMQGLKVIGITGSYGKSSVKEFLTVILNTKFRVLKTPGNTNTEIGVARIVLKDLKQEHEVFVVEAGAYKIGEIDKIARLVQPRISIVTAVKDAHLALFGSIENLKKAKFELIEALPEYGVAIFNQDNEGSKDLMQRAANKKLAKVIGYSIKEKANLEATNVVADSKSISFVVKGVNFKANLPGEHNVSNILAAMAAALEMGIKLEEMVEAVAELKMREHTMTVTEVSEKLTIIDDTYNANPDGLMAGLNYLEKLEGYQKVIVFPGMLELGNRSDEEHLRVGKRIKEVCDYGIFTSNDFEKPLGKGLGNVDEKKFIFLSEKPTEVEKKIIEIRKNGKTAIYFSSRGAEKIIRKLKSLND
ncbi:UDP-N-acetylmuramoyl-tripeptide--D-alanyl-D-alanine ligase [Candidatus Peregrinibacteria bacterium]|nr:UDP-N-acetylmuramoyl-tripeptide--D-alanyl-D-alanine ligase [Candidatus Peregrinibacteria bacterium]